MDRRCCHNVIQEMLDYIPKTEIELINDLEWNFQDSLYKAPEEKIQWIRTSETLGKHLSNLTEDWQYKVVSIFTTKTINELKEMDKINEKI